ncbi:pseudouridine synthase [Desulfitobacterium sp. AusDCA]
MEWVKKENTQDEIEKKVTDSRDKQGERLQKVLAHAGIASRRQAEQMILEGEVAVNGKIVQTLGTKVFPEDKVTVKGKPIAVPSGDYVYFLLNKPTGVITSAKDPQGRKTVVELLRKVPQRVYPVGRLDYDTSGLLVLTNDGELAHRLMHPHYGVEKTYRVGIKEKLTVSVINQLRNGILLEDGKTAPAKIHEVNHSGEGSFFFYDITIHEGRNRQVRRMFSRVGHPLITLQRIGFGPLKLDSKLLPGMYRSLNKQEVQALRRTVQLN